MLLRLYSIYDVWVIFLFLVDSCVRMSLSIVELVLTDSAHWWGVVWLVRCYLGGHLAIQFIILWTISAVVRLCWGDGCVAFIALN